VLHNQPESSQELLRRNNRELVDVMGGHTDTPVPAPALARNYRVSRAKPTGRITNMRTLDARLKQAQAVDPAAVKLAGIPFASLLGRAAKAPAAAKAAVPAAVKAPAAAVRPSVTTNLGASDIRKLPQPAQTALQQMGPGMTALVGPQGAAQQLRAVPTATSIAATRQNRAMVDSAGSWTASRPGAAAASKATLPPGLLPGAATGTIGAAGAYGLGRVGNSLGRQYLPEQKPVTPLPAAAVRQKGAGLPLGRNFATKMLVGGPLAAGGVLGSYGLGRALTAQSPEAYRRSVNDPVDAAQAEAARAYKTQTSDSLDLADQRRTAVADAAKRPAPLAGVNQSTRGVPMPAPVRPIAAPVSPRRVAIGTGPRLGTAAPEMPEMYTPPATPATPAPVESPKQVAAPRLTAPDAVASAAKGTPPSAGSSATGADGAGVTSPAQAAAAATAIGRGARTPGGAVAGGAIAGRAANREAGGALSSLLSNLSPGMQNGLMVGGAGIGLVGLYKLLSAARAQRSREEDTPQAAPQQSGYGMMPMGYPGYGAPQHQPRTIILQ
jgi:hypothetical protein